LRCSSATARPSGMTTCLRCTRTVPSRKVFDAIELVGAKLRPLWSGVAEPFPAQVKKGGANISLGTIRRIQSMKRQGYKVGFIASALATSTETVGRWSKRDDDGTRNA